jgi:hypothetical protein
MKYIYAFIVKFIMAAAILEILLYLLTQLSFREILMISFAAAFVTFLVGDLLILGLSNNMTATLSNAVLSFLTVYAFNLMAGYERIDFIDALVCALVIGVGDWIYHRYMARSVYPDRRRET